jgi:uncharacterized membrane protein
MKTPLIYKFLNDDELLRISNKIKAEEKITAGEICVSIKERRSLIQKNKPVRKLAEEEFFKLGIDKTRDKTGIIIFFLLEAREFYILADEGINNKVPEKTWDKIKDEMQSHFMEGNFSQGIIHGVERVGKILSEHFPIKSDDTNEISNRVVLE